MLFGLLHHDTIQPPLGNHVPAKPDTDGFCMEADEELSCIPFHHLAQKCDNKQPGMQSHVILPQPLFYHEYLWLKCNQNMDTLMHMRSRKQHHNKSSSHPAFKTLVWNFSLATYFKFFSMILYEPFSLSSLQKPIERSLFYAHSVCCCCFIMPTLWGKYITFS